MYYTGFIINVVCNVAFNMYLHRTFKWRNRIIKCSDKHYLRDHPFLLLRHRPLGWKSLGRYSKVSLMTLFVSRRISVPVINIY